MSTRGRDLEAPAADASEVEYEADVKPPLLVRGTNQGWVLLICGAIGWIASFGLTVEYIHKLESPGDKLVCDVNPFITCGPAMLSDAGHVLGFPNVILGLTCFTIAVVTGVVVLLGARLPKWYWICFEIGLIGAAALITYLQIFSVFGLARLCLWCMIIWATTIPLVVTTTLTSLARGRFGAAGASVGLKLAGWSWVITLLWYLAVIAMIFSGMWDVFALSFV